MEKKSIHILLVPYPAQGHINPILQFSKRLQQKAAKVTLVTTNFISKTTHNIPSTIPIQTISDGHDESGYAAAASIQSYLDSLRKFGSQTLRELLHNLSASGQPVDCIVYDGFLPWILEITKELGLKSAVFFTQSCAVCSIYYRVHRGSLKLPLSDEQIHLPGLPPLNPPEFPSFVHQFGTYPAFYDLIVNQYSNVGEADWILCNTFYELEQEVLDWLRRIWPRIRTIGPSIPSMFLDRRIEDDRDYGLNLFNPNSAAIEEWLNGHGKGTVVYVSFGSFGEIEAQQIEEMAWGLKRCNCPFLWVVRASEATKLPNNFTSETSEKGKVVPWCPQLQVLSHDSIGCFVTHCGWNSTLESLSLGVPMVAIPGWTDQTTNAKFIADVWKVGIIAPADERGIVGRETAAYCVKEVMEGDVGTEIRRNVVVWKDIAAKAFREGGTSNRCVQEFLAGIR